MLYEVGLTRILSVVLWYHFAFLSISLAMLGLGVPGVWFSLRPPRPQSLRRALLAAAVTLPLSVYAILHGGLWVPHTTGGWWLVAFIVLCILAPMISLGAGVCLLLLRAEGRGIGGMYASDLAGAMAGTVAILPLMFLVPTPLILAGAAILPIAGLVLLPKPGYPTALALGLALAAAVYARSPFEAAYNKVYPETKLEFLYEKWTPTARITILPFSPFKKDQTVPWGWGYGRHYTPRPLEQWWIDQDSSAGTPVEHPDPALSTLGHLFFDVTGVGYQLRPPASVAIIGPGGGRDILTALKSGATAIDAIEMNGAIVEVLSSAGFRDFTGDVYHMPGVHAVVSEGRSYLARTDRRYDLIQISLVDSWAATSAGAYALSERYLYTVEAFRLYLERLEENGLISISRYISGEQQMEGTRLALLALEALRRSGVEDPKAHIAIIGGGKVCTLLIGRRPLTDYDLNRLARIAEERGFFFLWPWPETMAVSSIVTESIRDGPVFLESRGFDLSPPTDDRPFFFQSMSLLTGAGSDTGEIGRNEFAVVLLRRVILAVILLAAVLYLLPFLLAGRIERHPGFWRGSGYFAAIGLGFMLVELPWIQRFILYLGHPSYATTVVISSVLLGASLGSRQAGRVTLPGVTIRLAVLLPVAILATNLLLSPLFSISLGWPLPARCLAGWLALLPAGFLMGFAFPVGMRWFGDPDKAWFWAMNGVTSVAGSVLSLGLAMVVGFSNVVLAGVAAYLAAWLLLRVRAAAPAASS